MTPDLPRVAVFSGPTATIQNTPPLRTRVIAAGRTGNRTDTLRAQRLAAPAVVYVERFSGHPLEADSADLYGPPDGYLDRDGAFHPAGAAPASPAEHGWRPVLRVELDPADGPFLLPYADRTRQGSPWAGSGLADGAPEESQRQTFYPDASRLYEEIDRFGLDSDGYGRPLSCSARFAFFRAMPSGGYRSGIAGPLRTDHELTRDGIGPATASIAAERRGEDYFGYYPWHLRTEPDAAALARATNLLQETLGSGQFTGGQWLEGSPTAEESLYWFNLLLDVTVPLAGHTAQRKHGSLSADGDGNIVDGVRYLTSRVWADEHGRDAIGTVLIADEVVYASRQVAKTGTRPGNHAATGGGGGIVGAIAGPDGPVVTCRPAALHTWRSELRRPELPESVPGLRGPVAVKDAAGRLRPEAMPAVTIVAYGRYADDGCGAAGLAGWLDHARRSHELAGIVVEGASGFGFTDPGTDAVLRSAAMSGVPVVKCGRGNTAGFTPRREPWAVSGSNLTATKARILLLAALLKLGALPAVADAGRAGSGDLAKLNAAVAAYQHIFDTH